MNFSIAIEVFRNFHVAVFLIEKRVIYNFPWVSRENMRGDTTEITSSEASRESWTRF